MVLDQYKVQKRQGLIGWEEDASEKMVCKKCANFGCTPFEKRLEQAEASDRARRSYGI